MKKLLLLLSVGLMALNFVSCTDDNEASSIVGAWNMVGYEATTVNTSSSVLTSAIKAVYAELTAEQATIVFNSNGTGTALWDGDEEESFTYSISGNKLTIADVYGEDEMNYTVSGNTLKIMEDITSQFDAETLSDMGFPGVTVSKIEIAMVFGKQ